MARTQVSEQIIEDHGIAFKQRLREGLLLISFAIAIYLLISLLTFNQHDPGWSRTAINQHIQNAGGRAGAWFADFFLYLFGYFAYLVPIMAAYGSWLAFREARYYNESNYKLFSLKCLGFLAILIAGSGLASLHIADIHGHIPFTAGGIVGSIIGPRLVESFNSIGTTLILVALFLGGVTWLTGLSWFKLCKFCLAKVKQFAVYTQEQVVSLYNKVKSNLQDRMQQRRERAELAPVEPKVNPIVEKIKQVATSITEPEPASEVSPEVPAIENTGIAIIPGKAPVKKSKKRKRPKGASSLPSLELLQTIHNSAVSGFTSTQLEEKSREVEQRLEDYSIQVKVVAVHPGPVVTRYELQLAPGVKASKLTNLAKDLARSLSMISVRVVEIIPGKSVVGLELPNEKRAVVSLKEVLESDKYAHARSPLSLALGKDIAGNPVIVDLAKMPHLLVAGTTGSGKSVGVNAMLMSILYKATPEEVRLILVDPKMLELSIYEGIPHLLSPVVTDMKEAANALRWCVQEMERRYRLMAALGVRNISGYNHKVREAIQNKQPIEDPSFPNQEGEDKVYLETLPYIVVIIDEFADMMMVVGKKVEQLIARIAQKARAAGIHLILATQRPSVDVITGLIKANIPTRIAFQVSSKVDSRTIIDQQGAEQLLGHGDMLYLAPGTGVPSRVHGAFVADQEVHDVVHELQQAGEPEYCPDVLTGASDESGASSAALTGIDIASGEQDPLYDDAVAFVTDSRKASISSVQRRFKIGYNRAARIIEEMEAAGVVSPMESNGSREVLAPPPPRD